METCSDPNGTALSRLLPSPQLFSRLVTWYRQEGMRFGPSFDRTRLNPVRTLANTMRTHRIIQRLQQSILCRGFSKQERCPKGIESLECSREAEGARYETTPDGCCSHHTPNQIIGQDVHPQFLPYHGRRFPADDIHPQRCLDGAQIQFRMPPAPIQLRNLLLGA